MTREIAVRHHRAYIDATEHEAQKEKEMGGVNNRMVYYRKFAFLDQPEGVGFRCRRRMFKAFARVVGGMSGAAGSDGFLGRLRQDLHNIAHCRYVAARGMLGSVGRRYHLVQEIPLSLLQSEGNPYRAVMVGGRLRTARIAGGMRDARRNEEVANKRGGAPDSVGEDCL